MTLNSLGNNSAMMDKHVNYSEFNLQLLLFGASSSQPEFEAWFDGLSGSSLTLGSLPIPGHRPHLGGSKWGDPAHVLWS